MRATVLVSIVVMIGGCDCGGMVVGSPCEMDGDCASGAVCVESVCTPGERGPDGAVIPLGDGSSMTGVDVPTGCGEFPFNVSSEPADLMLVVDRSLSMEDDIPGGGTKWEAMLAAVDGVTHALETSIHFGLASYAAEGGDLCAPGDVILDPAPNNADAIVNRLTRDGTGGATPTAASLENVGDYFQVPRAGHEDHSPAILLATDGAPNCNDALDGSSCTCTTGGGGGGGDCGGGQFCLDDMHTYSVIEAIAGGDPSVPVYVIGLPGTEAYADVLSEMARRGATARAGDPAYYAAGDRAALETALTEIASGFVGCVFSMDVAPANPRQVRILLDGMEVMHTDDRSEGWAYTNPENTVFELFGTPCDVLTDGNPHTVTAEYACVELF
jgi:hypothetical protein